MKKSILGILIAVMTATPCLAQEIEPEGIFSIDETLWEYTTVYGGKYNFGFYGDEVYQLNVKSGGCDRGGETSYYDFTFFSLFEYRALTVEIPYAAFSTRNKGIVFPLLGIGFFVQDNAGMSGERDINKYILKKVSDNWQPPSGCVQMLPIKTI